LEKTSTSPATSPKASRWNSRPALFCLRALIVAAIFTLPLAYPAAGPHDVQAGKAAEKSGPAKTNRLTEIRTARDGDHTRVTLFLEARPEYASDVFALPGKAKGRRGLVLELKNAVLAPKAAVPAAAGEASAAVGNIRVTQRTQGVLRVEMDLAGDCVQNVSTQDFPPRIVVDVSPEKKVAAKNPARTPDAGKPAPQAQAQNAEAAVKTVAYAPDQSVFLGKVEKTPPYKLPSGSLRQADSLVRQLGLTVRTIMIDPGHGGKDNGATGARGLHEKDVVLALAKILGAKLSALGFTVYYTRTTDVFIPLARRTEMANQAHADLFVSIHCNAHAEKSIHGLETYSMNLARTPEEVKMAARENASEQRKIGDLQSILTDLMLNSKMKESEDLAASVQGGVLASLSRTRPIRDHGVHEAPFFVLLGAKMPAVLVEVGYVTNPEEAASLSDKAYLDKLASGLVGGLLDYKAKIERYASL
jgi:N-acetylmuramoyl-L-alanine amidase